MPTLNWLGKKEGLDVTERKLEVCLKGNLGDKRAYIALLTKHCILEIYDQMTRCLATNTEYRSTLNPPPGPSCDSEGNFIPVGKWNKNNWPKNIHPEKAEYKI